MKILLSCAAGMSTSIIVKKMQEAAAAQGKNYEILALDIEKAEKVFEKYDVVLVGPQIRYMLSKFKAKGEATGIPVELINQMHYAMCNGEEVLKQAERLAVT
ncbi:PTS sugar transporter subunit IIB [Peribacillus muralis]|uniref:PTS sugar transporter subunit IIB n=1 Tax=Peribacillus muralis TaxID=264697 RepID=UPI00366D637A